MFWRFLVNANVKGLVSAFANMVAPATADEVPLTSLNIGCLVRAEADLNDNRIISRNAHSNRMKKRGTKAQDALDDFVMGMTQQTH